MGLVGRTRIRGVEPGREACRVRRSLARSYSDFRSMWNIPVTAADTPVGDADVSGRSEGGVTTPSSLGIPALSG